MIKAVLTHYNGKILLAQFSEDKIVELSFYSDEDSPGTVYLCRVSKSLPNIEACFVSYKEKHNGFYKCKNIKQETILPLMLKREATGSKEPLFTDKITLSSDLAVISRGDARVNVSGKLGEDIKLRLKDHFAQCASELNLSIVLRTNCENADYDDIYDDIVRLSERLKKIETDSKTRTLYSVLYRPEPEYIKQLKDIRRANLSEIVTDDEAFYAEIKNAFSQNDDIGISLYKDSSISLLHLMKLENIIKNSTKRTVPLKSGGEIIIDRTEALTAIDVNTHYSESKGSKEDTFYKTNVEAAHEIMRQLRLRNISGMIVIDFINMERNDHYDELTDIIKKSASEDPVGVKFIDITGLKLVELIRTKKKNSIYDQMR